MFHVKHNEKDNIIHVHIDTRTRRQARRQAYRRPDAPAAPAAPPERQARRAHGRAVGQAGDRTSKRTSKQGQRINLLLYRWKPPIYIGRLSYMYFSSYIYVLICTLPKAKKPKKGLDGG